MLLRPPTPTLFPYTTLFRSSDLKGYFRAQTPFLGRWVAPVHEYHRLLAHGLVAVRVDHLIRSEEHTSELQSRGHLVCRLLLEKKKNRTHTRRELMKGSREHA